ncbi:hypothetical protein [Bordetella sp. LUAb4]|uniref:hypothetical protein n=1 Tax=Bordetella sp. LUAb4 TaxID=2843195 RepID=UPI001E4FA0BB|nr:hypothetical protein [Bordetella sp. LUAb4]
MYGKNQTSDNGKNQGSDDSKNQGSDDFNPMLVTGEDKYSESNPQVVIRIMVDTDVVLEDDRQGTVYRGIYMLDNRAYYGSGAQGGDALDTHCRYGEYVAFYVTPVDPYSEDKLSIIGFEMVSGDDVWGTNGLPTYYAPSATTGNGVYWVGTIEGSGNSLYRVKCKLQTAGEDSQTVAFTWTGPGISVITG